MLGLIKMNNEHLQHCYCAGARKQVTREWYGACKVRWYNGTCRARGAAKGRVQIFSNKWETYL